MEASMYGLGYIHVKRLRKLAFSDSEDRSVAAAERYEATENQIRECAEIYRRRGFFQLRRSVLSILASLVLSCSSSTETFGAGGAGGAGGLLELGGAGGGGSCFIVGTPCAGPECCGAPVQCCPIDGGAVCSEVCP
jgi:hypothetical protein